MEIHIINSAIFGGAESIAANLCANSSNSYLVNLFGKENLNFESKFNFKLRNIWYLFKSIRNPDLSRVYSHNLQSHIFLNFLSYLLNNNLLKSSTTYNVIHFDVYHVKKIYLLLYFLSLKLYKPKIIFVSDFAKLRFLEKFKIKNIFYKVIYNSIEKKYFKQSIIYKKFLPPIKKDKVVIGFIGRNKPVKRLDKFIELCFHLNKIDPSKFSFLIQSDIKYKELEELIYQKKIQKEKIKINLFTDSSDPINFYENVDIVISTSKTETFGLTCIEALAMGKRIYSINSQSLSLLLGKGDFNISTENPDKISQIINKGLYLEYKKPDISRFQKNIMIGEYHKF
jgi:glycosyltransferase involved in cell wall biosynthesis